MMLMLYVITPSNPITARARKDFLEMEEIALVTICNTVWFNASLTS